MTSIRVTALALAAVLLALPATDARAQTAAAQPAAAPPAGNPPPPGYPYPPPNSYPPSYGYPPGYGYPPAYGYPPPYPVYPQGYPQAPYAYPPAYPAYPPPYPAPAPEPPEPPARLPGGKWRLGAAVLLLPQGYLAYDLKYRSESLQTYSRGTTLTAGITAFAEYDPIRHVFVGLAVQYLPSIQWEPVARSSSSSNSYGGTASEVDFLPQIGATFNPIPRLRLLAYAAPGYSVLAASGLLQGYANLGTARGFVMQTGGGVLFAASEHLFFGIRGSYQWGFQNEQVQSLTTGEPAEARFRSHFVALQGAAGYWF